MKLIEQMLLVGVVCVAMAFTAACGSSESADASSSITTTSPTTAVTDAFSFTATVIEVGEDWLMVEADAGSTVSGQVRVLLQQPVSVTAGARIVVQHTGQMMPSLPPQLVAVAIEVL